MILSNNSHSVDSIMKVIVILVILSSCIGLEAVDFNLTTIPNFITDIVLAEVRHYLNTHNDTNVPIPEVDVDFKTKLGLRAEFIASNGVFRNPAAVKRLGDTEIIHGNKKYLMTLNIGFETMTIYFPEYTARIAIVSESGEIFIKVGKNAMVVQVTVIYSPQCVITVNEVKMTEFEDLAVRITGLGVLNTLEAEIVQRVLASYRDSFTPIIENIVNSKLQEVFSKTSLCKFKPS